MRPEKREHNKPNGFPMNLIKNFEVKKKTCGCGKEFHPLKTTDKYCRKCFYKKLSETRAGKLSLKREKLAQAARKPIKKSYKPTGEMKMFLEIWSEREHKSELSGVKLPYGMDNMKMWVCQFLHVLPKGKFPSMRLNKRNIMLATPIEHEYQDRYLPFTERKTELLNEIYKK